MKDFANRKKLPRVKFFAAAVITAAALLCALSPAAFAKTEAYANSAQRYWSGVDSFGVTSIGGECPLEVESEKLIFNIQDFSQPYESESEKSYTQTVTAEYNFYNPSDLEVTANLVFPFGSETYADYQGVVKYSGDIKADGAPVPFNVRYTYLPYGEFTVRNIENVRDDYNESGFFTRDLPVTRYYFSVSGVEKNDENAPYASIKLPISSDKKYALRGDNGSSRNSYSATVGKFVKNGDTLELSVYGDADISDSEWVIYENGGEKKKIGGSVTLKYKKATTFGEAVFANYDEKFGVSRVDWFNAAVDCLNDNVSDCVLRHNGDFNETFVNALMRWYEYDLTVPPRGRVVNSVTAPLFPNIDAGYEPSVHSYVYYSSPAKTWKSFGTLNVEINTPYYMVFDDDGWTKTDGGYTRFYETLPAGEITFKLCSSESPERYFNPAFGKAIARFLWFCILFGVVVIGVPIIVAAVIVIIFYKKSRKKVALKAANSSQGGEQNGIEQGGGQSVVAEQNGDMKPGEGGDESDKENAEVDKLNGE